MTILFANNCSSTLNGGITGTATTILIQSSDAPTWPSPATPSDYFMVTLEDKTQNPVLREIVKCTNRSGTALTIIRAQENTTAQSFNSGITVEVRITAGVLNTILAGTAQPVTLYLGAFATAPSSGVNQAPLVPGNLYFNTVSRQLFNFDGAFWDAVLGGTQSIAFGQYLGAFSTPPLTMNNGTALVQGTLYYDTSQIALFEWTGVAWANAATVTINVAPTGATNTAGANGVFSNITVLNNTATGTLTVGGLPVITSANLPGDATGQNFPDGARIQWGQVPISNSSVTHDTTITFPRPFTTLPLFVIASCTSPPVNGGPQYVICTLVGVSNSQAIFECVDALKLAPSVTASILGDAASAVLTVAGSFVGGSVGALVGGAIGGALQPKPVGHGGDPITGGVLNWIAVGSVI